MNELHYIAVEGVIGAGKTSLATLLSEKLNGNLILERFENNPYLKDFYLDTDSFAFRTQMFFLLDRFTQLRDISQRDLFHSMCISDFIFEKDKIFAYLNLKDSDLKIYEKIVSVLEKNLIVPDLVIYLQTTVKKLMENIRARMREVEKPITEKYIEALNDAYNYFFSRYKSSKVLIVNCEQIDFVNNPADLEELMAQILKRERSAIEYYNPSLKKDLSLRKQGSM